jgi:hypothetical protein
VAAVDEPNSPRVPVIVSMPEIATQVIATAAAL